MGELAFRAVENYKHTIFRSIFT